ncbi:MAG: helix-turn-helix domain-containing protein [Ktedonobacterales bacterium]|nr:helix-turn-helix domain-containing protein [Ktedonobacterales bacterium]
MLNDHEQKRLLVLNAVVAGQSSVKEAAASLELTEHQVCRVLARYREEGAAALAHGNWGAPTRVCDDEGGGGAGCGLGAHNVPAATSST